MKTIVSVVAGLLLATQAFAQSPYVAGTIGAEVVRTTQVKAPGSTFDSGSGEALAGSLRVGTSVAERFGVELEFFRPGTIRTDANGPIYYALEGPVLASLIADGALPEGVVASMPALSILSQRSWLRTTTTSALAYARQGAGSRVDLIYLGGIGFSRVLREVEFGIPRGILPAGRPVVPSYSTRTTQYAVGPVVGIEARVSMTEHARLVAGLRMHALGPSHVDGWLVRPSVGLAWQF